MQYDAETPEAYLEMLDDDWRKDRLMSIRGMLLGVERVEESIGYKMLRYTRGDDILAHLNAQKAYVGVYLGNVESLDPSGELTAKMNVGKGCVRVRKTEALDGVAALIARKSKRLAK